MYGIMPQKPQMTNSEVHLTMDQARKTDILSSFLSVTCDGVWIYQTSSFCGTENQEQIYKSELTDLFVQVNRRTIEHEGFSWSFALKTMDPLTMPTSSP